MPPGTASASAPSIVSGGEPGTRTLNYRNEPIPHRVAVPPTPDPSADKSATDLAHVFRSIERSDPAMNKQPTGPIAPASPFNFPQVFTDAQPFDPFTPLMPMYENDRVQIRVLVGADHEPHVFNLQGLKWQTEPQDSNSGFRANQVMSISEHFEMNFTVPPASVNAAATASGDPPSTDYLYQAMRDIIGVTQGAWGLMRAYRGTAPEAGRAAGQSARRQTGECSGNPGFPRECGQCAADSQIQGCRGQRQASRSAATQMGWFTTSGSAISSRIPTRSSTFALTTCSLTTHW